MYTISIEAWRNSPNEAFLLALNLYYALYNFEKHSWKNLRYHELQYWKLVVLVDWSHNLEACVVEII